MVLEGHCELCGICIFFLAGFWFLATSLSAPVLLQQWPEVNCDPFIKSPPRSQLAIMSRQGRKRQKNNNTRGIKARKGGCSAVFYYAFVKTWETWSAARDGPLPNEADIVCASQMMASSKAKWKKGQAHAHRHASSRPVITVPRSGPKRARAPTS